MFIELQLVEFELFAIACSNHYTVLHIIGNIFITNINHVERAVNVKNS